jgi:hypothetical protein
MQLIDVPSLITELHRNWSPSVWAAYSDGRPCLEKCQNRWFLERMNGVNPVLMQYVSHLLERHFVDLRNPALVDAE